MKNIKILILFLLLGLIIILFSGCIPTIPSSPSEIIDAENYNKNNDIVLGIPYYSAEGINNGCLCAAGAMIFGYYGFNVSPQELADYGLLMFPETILNDEFGLFTELKRYAISNLNLKAKYGFLSIKKIKKEIDKGVPIIVLQYSKFPRIIENLHYRVIHGYNDTEEKFVASCAQGAYYDLSYSEFLHLNLIENVDKCPSIIIESNNLNVEADVDPKNGTPPHEVHCVGFASEGPIPYTYQWEFGDGNWSEKGMGVEHKNVFHTYLKSGTYKPILHVEDSGGNMGKCTAGVVTVEKKIPFIDGSVFANKQWIVDTDESPGSNLYSDSIENIWLDELGQLHFRMTRDKETKRWKCIEIYSAQQEWGYGKYEFEIEVVSDGRIDENVVIGLFTYDSGAPEEYFREIDYEYSKWGIPEDDNSQFVIQYIPDSIERFDIPLDNYEAKISFDWREEEIIFYYQCGDKEEEIILPKNGESCKPPAPGNERVYMNLWLYNGKPHNEDNMEKVEIIIKDFVFTPCQNNSPEIHNLIANPDGVEIGQNSTVACDASDPDGDTLTYNWTSPDGGTISGSGSTITWTAPSTAGLYPVICTVSDGKGGSDEATVTITVSENILGIYYVAQPADGGDDSNSGSDTSPWASIQHALNTPTDEEFTVVVKAGTYFEGGITFPSDKRIILQSESGAENTIIDGSGIVDPVLIIKNVEEGPIIHSFTISGGNGNYTHFRGGGIHIYHSSPTITDNNISYNSSGVSNNDVEGRGGGIYIDTGSPIITNNIISYNSAFGYGGGIFMYGQGSPIITNNIISYNSAVSSSSAYGQGGGIFVSACSPTIANNTISNNNSNKSGGGISMSWAHSVTITNNTISNNISTYQSGGGISMTGTSPSIIDNIISNNKACKGGGGISIFRSCLPSIGDNTILDNTASIGGGIYGYSKTSLCQPAITNNTISNNKAEGNNINPGVGGGIYLSLTGQYCYPTIIGNTISNNEASDEYGGIYTTSCSPTIGSITIEDEKNIICGNTSPQCYPLNPPGNVICDICSGSCAP